MDRLLPKLMAAFALLLLLGCAAQGQPSPPPGQSATPPSAPPQEPAKNATAQPAPQAPSFTPISLSYLFTNTDPQGREQRITLDYYFEEKTTCSGRPALNGIAKRTDEANRPSYMKVTEYLDTGEAVYSDYMGEADLAFDTARPRMDDLDAAFALPTLLARAGKKLLSDEVWNATKPVLLKSVPAFGGTGDYSLSQAGTETVAGVACTKFSLAAKTSTMEGQIMMCVSQREGMAFLASSKFPGDNSPSWQLTSSSSAKSGIAYYPQCLAPIQCPSLSRPSQEEYDACSAQGGQLEAEKDKNNCVAAFRCFSASDRARRRLSESQRPGCEVKDEFVQQTLACWQQGGNANYQNDARSGCINRVDCSLPPQ